MDAKELRAERDSKIKEIRLHYARLIEEAIHVEAASKPVELPDPNSVRDLKLVALAKDLRRQGASFAEIGRRIGRSSVVAKSYVEQKREDLSSRATYCIQTAIGREHFSAADVSNELSYSDLKKVSNLGKKTIGEIEHWLKRSGFTLRD